MGVYNMILFGNRLHDLRIDNDLTSEEFANILHITTRALNYYENNMREPSFPLLIQMATYFKVSTDYLLGITDIPTQYPQVYK